MLHAIKKKKSKVAQEGFVKFQYALTSSVTMLGGTALGRRFTGLTTIADWIGLLMWLYIVFSPIVHLVGGFAVLQVFKRNHPLARLRGSQVLEALDQDLLEQNEAIASELSKYDEQFGRWPYFVYTWLLKFCVVLELISLFQYALPILIGLGQMSEKKKKDSPVDFFVYLLLIEWALSSFLNAYSCFEMEVAMRTRMLEKTKRALFLLKICTVFAISKCLFAARFSSLRETFDVSETLPSHFFWVGCFVVAPVLTLIGAFRVKNILEQRDNFVKVSSYSEDSYL